MAFFYKIYRNKVFYNIIKRYLPVNSYSTCYTHRSTLINLVKNDKNKTYLPKCLFSKIMLSTSLLTWLGFRKDEESESELIMTLKRSVLCMQRKEYVKAEQILHLALRLAQQQGNPDGITYAYDLMANLALEREQYQKSEKIFINVLQRLLSTGTNEDDLKVIHISLKLARICQKMGDHEKAEIGYKWCLDSIKKHLTDDNKDALALYGAILDWYANFLSANGEYKKSLQYLENAYDIYSKIEGINNEKAVLLLNDLGTVNCLSGNYDKANELLLNALKIGKSLDDFNDLGIIYTNLGLVKIKLGLLNEAKKFCQEGWRIGNKGYNTNAMDQAKYCLDQLGLT